MEQIDQRKLDCIFEGCVLEDHPVFFFDAKEFMTDLDKPNRKPPVQYLKLRIIDNVAIMDNECLRIDRTDIQFDGNKTYFVTRKYKHGDFLFSIQTEMKTEETLQSPNTSLHDKVKLFNLIK